MLDRHSLARRAGMSDGLPFTLARRASKWHSCATRERVEFAHGHPKDDEAVAPEIQQLTRRGEMAFEFFDGFFRSDFNDDVRL